MSHSSIITTSEASHEQRSSMAGPSPPGVPLTKDRVEAIFALLASGCSDQFFEYVADDVDWTVKGTHPLAGHYTSKEAFLNATFRRLRHALEQGIPLQVDQILLDGDWAVVELRSTAKAKNGGWDFSNEYAWVLRWDSTRQVFVEVRAYLDSALVARLVTEHPDAFMQ